jgi:hypothetical protein
VKNSSLRAFAAAVSVCLTFTLSPGAEEDTRPPWERLIEMAEPDQEAIERAANPPPPETTAGESASAANEKKPAKKVREKKVREPKPPREKKPREPKPPKEPSKPKEPRQPRASQKAAEPAPAEQAAPVTEPVKAQEPPKPAEPVRAQEPPKPAEPVRAQEPPKPAEPARAEEPPKPEEPVRAEEPPKPEESKKPAAPGVPAAAAATQESTGESVSAAEPEAPVRDLRPEKARKEKPPKAPKEPKPPKEPKAAGEDSGLRPFLPRLGLRAGMGVGGLGGHRKNLPLTVGIDSAGRDSVIYDTARTTLAPSVSAGIGLVYTSEINDMLGVTCEIQYTFYYSYSEEVRRAPRDKKFRPLHVAQVQLHSLELPVLLRINAGDLNGMPFYAEVGPQLGINLYGRLENDGDVWWPNLSGFALGPTVGCGIEAGAVDIGVRGHFGLLDYVKRMGGRPWAIQLNATSYFK